MIIPWEHYMIIHVMQILIFYIKNKTFVSTYLSAFNMHFFLMEYKNYPTISVFQTQVPECYSLFLSFSLEKCALENPWTLLPVVSMFIGKIFSEHASLLKWTDTGDWLLYPYLEGYWMPYQFNHKWILLFCRIWYLYIAGSSESCMGRKWTP